MGASIRSWTAVAGMYLLGSILFLWPMPAHLQDHIWGDRFDAWTTLWLMDHFYRHLSEGNLQAVTQDILFPIGYNLWSFGHAALQFAGVGLMFCGVPLVAAYNLLLIGGFWTSGLAAHGLGRELSGDHRGGFVAGIVFATSPYLYGEGAAGCIELVAAGLLPLFGWTLIRLCREPGWKRAVVSAGVLAMVGPFNWYYTLFAGMFGVGFLLWQLFEGRRKAGAWMAGAMMAAALLDAPLIPLVQRETPARPPISGELFEDTAAWERATAISNGEIPLTDLTESRLEEHDALQVMENSTTLRALAMARFTVNPLESTPGFLAFAVGILGAAAAGRRGFGWAVIAAGATLLTLGPFLRLDSTPELSSVSADYPLPYYYFYHYLPFFSKAYRPYRIGVVTLLCCAALGAAGSAVLRIYLPKWLQLGAVGVLGLLGVSQPFWSGDAPALRPLADATIPEIYRQLRDLPPGGVVEVPLQYQPLTLPNARFQYNQIAHQHPLLNCNQLIRRTDLMAFRNYVTQNSFLSMLVDIGRKNPPLQFTRVDLEKTYADGFRYLVVHRSAAADDVSLAGSESSADLVGEPAMELFSQLFGAPLLADDDTEIYGIPATVGADVLSWSGDDVLDLPFGVDARKTGMALPIRGGKRLFLWRGAGRQISFWLRPESGESLSIRVGDRETPLRLVKGQWSWQQVPLSGQEEDIFLVASSDVTVRMTRLQVLR